MAHEDVGGGHFGGEITSRKVLQQGLWWETLHRDFFTHARTCDRCQRLGPLREGNQFNPIIPSFIFDKWGLDYIGPINPSAQYTQNKYIIAITE